MSETKTGQGERLKFSFGGLDVLMAFGALRQLCFFVGHYLWLQIWVLNK